MSQPSPIAAAIKQICEEKHISYEAVIETIEAALAVAYRKDFGEKDQNIKVDFDPETTNARVFDVKKVVSDEFYEQAMKELEEAKQKAEEEAAAGSQQPAVGKDASGIRDQESGDEGKSALTEERPQAESEELKAATAEAEPRFDPKLHLPLSKAKELKKGAEEGDEIRTELFPPSAYGRMAAQTAKQVIIQRLREAEREAVYNEFKDKQGILINGTIQRVEGRMVLVDLGQATAIMPPPEQIHREFYRPGTRLKFFVASVAKTPRGPEIVVSRSHPEMVKKLFEMEVPEVASAAVEIRSIAREAGSRTKIAVFSNQKNIDPVGSCVGQRGTRVQTVIGELGGEKIDIIEWSDDNVKFITNALSPAKVLSLKLDEENRVATVEVKEDQVSLAIGKGGQNVRLAAKLTGWKIDIVSEEGTVRSAPKDDGAGRGARGTDEKVPEGGQPEAETRADASGAGGESGISNKESEKKGQESRMEKHESGDGEAAAPQQEKPAEEPMEKPTQAEKP
ncbi:MAG: transcription termination/antitermination protein NusA [Candidatus Kerfeldbacteria bacterium]|nr:transcription termination/antitermination protein NusA [Candidatus Kerfeldbacteria bacterium]